ncbi:MAG: NAD(P)/FAD-dependent oxidoreductase [Gammaproteobacteria bacterium]
MTSPYRIIVVGGGAGGLELVTKLGRRYRKRKDIEIVLVDKNYAHIWKPLLHEVAAGTLNSNDDELSYLAQAHWNHFEFKLGEISAVERANKVLTIAPTYDDEGAEYIPERTIRYDILVIAVGSITNDFGIDGIAENCFFLDGRHQADHFHKHLVRSCYTANVQTTPIREGQLHIAIAGAGATGVELAAELHHSIHALVGFGLQNIELENDLKIHLIEGSERILPGLSEKISRATHEALERIGVEIHVNEFVSKADELGFHTKSGKFIPAEIKVWAAGIKGPDVLSRLDGLETNRINQLIVNDKLQTTLDESIFALGDCAACPIGEGEFAPPRAQAAHQQASAVAQSITHLIKNDEPVHFEYRDFGSLINLSTTSTVGSLMGNLFGRQSGSVAIEGWFARGAYLSLYKMHQIAVQGFVRTCALTIANWITRSSKPRLKLH